MRACISIVIPTWNGLALLKRFLPSVISSAKIYSEQSGASVEIIVVDDASSDETIEWLLAQGFEERKPEVERSPSGPQTAPLDLKFVKNEINLGFGEACNRGFAAASCPLVFLLNNDVEITADSISPLVENFEDDSVLAAHCRVFDLDSGEERGTGKVGGFARGFFRVHRSYAPTKAQIENGDASRSKFYSMFAGGGSAMFDRKKFFDIGGFEPLLSPFYWEDVELSYRAWKRGFTVLYEPRSAARHRVSSTIGKLNRRRVRLIEQRNRLIYHWIHLHDKRLLASHILWAAMLALLAPFRLRPIFLFSFLSAMRMLPQIRKRRRQEKRAAKRSDRDVLAIFASFARRDDVIVYDRYEELQRFRQKTGANRPIR